MEIILILIIALVVLGPERFPELLRISGKVMRELRLASNTVMRELSDGFDDLPTARTEQRHASVLEPGHPVRHEPEAPKQPPSPQD